MSYRGLGQAKWVPGQIAFATTRTGRIPNVQPLVEAGLPIAPYIEHGSWETGQPAIMRYGLDPYRGLLGTPQPMGQALTDWACDQTAFAQAWRRRLNDALDDAALACVIGAGAGGLLGSLIQRPILASAAGAAVGLAAHAIWTAPLRVPA